MYLLSRCNSKNRKLLLHLVNVENKNYDLKIYEKTCQRSREKSECCHKILHLRIAVIISVGPRAASSVSNVKIRYLIHSGDACNHVTELLPADIDDSSVVNETKKPLKNPVL